MHPQASPEPHRYVAHTQGRGKSPHAEGANCLLAPVGAAMAESRWVTVMALLATALVAASCGEPSTAPAPTTLPSAAIASASPTATATAVPTPKPAPTPVPPPAVLGASATLMPDNPLIVQVQVTLDRPARVYVEYTSPGAGTFRTATTESEATTHVVPVVRLSPNPPMDRDGRREGSGRG